VSQGENAPTVTSDDVANLAHAADARGDDEAAVESASLGSDDLEDPEDFDPEDLEDPEDYEQDDPEESAALSVEDEELAAQDEELSAEDENFVANQENGDGADGARPEADPADLEQESEIAADYVEGLLDVADLDGDIDMDVEGDRALVSVVGATLQELIGPRGEVLEALQELTRLAVHRQTGMRTRIMLDVGGYRVRRRSELAELGKDVAEEVRTSGVPKRLAIMTPFERKVVHDAVAFAGLRSESEGEEPNRRVVVFPAG
jgi:spoIIIJ-associated protein